MAKVKSGKKSATQKPETGAPPALLLMNALPDPVVAFDAMLKVSFSNRAAQGFFKFSEKQMLAKYMVELLGNQNAVFESVETIVRKNQTVTLHDVSVRERPASSVMIATIEPDRVYLMVIRQQPMQLAHEWKETMGYSLKSIQMLAHEIKGPLAGISRAAQELSKSVASIADKKLAGLIEHETQEIQALVDKFNVFHDVSREHHKEISLHEVHERVARLAQESYGDSVEIESSIDPSLPNIRGHFDQLVQAKLNLIRNAAEAFPDKKGKILIRTFYNAAFTAHPENTTGLPLCIEIEDNGQGITPEMIGRIFQPYFTTKPNSQGLGLPIVSKIVDDHGGTVSVDSKPGKTVFRINLPVPPESKP